MSAPEVELLLARLYTDVALREQFLRDAEATLKDVELTDTERASLLDMDRTGLHMAAHSYANKHAKKHAHHTQKSRPRLNWLRVFFRDNG